jgi:hypothetical protein
MLTIDNNDPMAVEEDGAPETLDFWDVVNVLSIEEMFPHLEAEDVAELEALVSDRRRLHRQANELIRLQPDRIHQTCLDLCRAMNEVERRIKSILLARVHYTHMVDVEAEAVKP